MLELRWQNVPRDWEAEGPWDAEPDKVQWTDPATGYSCLAVRNRHGCWCGYVGLEPGHRYHGADYEAVPVDVHGGLTFAERCMEDERPLGERVCHIPTTGSDAVWWLGFDCGHAFDLVPGMRSIQRRIELESPLPGLDARYCDLAYVRAEVESLARQLARR